MGVNPYIRLLADFYGPDAFNRTKKGILLSALKNKFPIRPFYSEFS